VGALLLLYDVSNRNVPDIRQDQGIPREALVRNDQIRCDVCQQLPAVLPTEYFVRENRRRDDPEMLLVAADLAERFVTQLRRQNQ
jgi:hypothetical protein